MSAQVRTRQKGTNVSSNKNRKNLNITTDFNDTKKDFWVTEANDVNREAMNAL